MSSIRTIALSILHRYQQHGSHFSSVDSILTFTEFRSDYGVYQGNHLTDADLWLLLRYMTCQYGLGVDSNVRGYGRSHVAIKFPEHNENSITATTTTNNTNSIIMDPPPTNTISSTQINESDKAIISLKTTCKALHDQVNKLQLQLESAVKQSLSYSSKQQKPQALYAVKRKLQLEQILNRRLQSLETMETLLLKIDASHNDIQIIQAFNMGVASLKQIFNDNGLTVTSVDETMLNMQTTLEEHERVEEAMTNGQQYIFTAMGRSNKINEDDNDDVEENIQQVSDNNRLTLPRIASQEKRTRNDLEDDDDNAHLSEIPPPPPSATPNSELARLHAIFSALPQIPSDPPRSKQRRLRQLA
ncbi:hypothetical protein BCR42DRAFT_334349 [Absidia repens]|uniref:Snf7-domain-containing protein n=1 Tax=Absidia repens TaxID=90262 RepID=A0A1X2I591_9FUNG|nr:hypothetical protein BCR42DRAFT_334349 [Absidia repens]